MSWRKEIAHEVKNSIRENGEYHSTMNDYRGFLTSSVIGLLVGRKTIRRPLRKPLHLEPGVYDFVIYRPFISRLLKNNQVVLKFEPHTDLLENLPLKTSSSEPIAPLNSHPRMAFGQNVVAPGEFLVQKQSDTVISALSRRSGHYLPTSSTSDIAIKIMRIFGMPLTENPIKYGAQGIRR